MLKLAPTPLVQQLLDALRRLPGADIRHVQQEPRTAARTRGHAAVIDLQLGARPLTLLVEERKSVYPRDVQQVLWQLKSQQTTGTTPTGADIVPLLAAESLSAGAAELLRVERIAYFDSGGSLFLPTPGAYVFLDKPPSRAQASAMRSVFSGRRSQAIHALLLRPSEWFGVKDLADLAQVSPATASGVLGELEKFDWVLTRGLGPRKQRQIREPGALLDAWAKQVTESRSPQLRRYFVPSAKKPDALLDQAAQAFEHHGGDYAVSHEAAAQRYAPFLSSIGQVRCRALMTSGTDAALAEMGARPVSEGANLVLIEAQSTGELLFRERVGKALLASPVHVYLDLLRGEGRAREMAAHLRQERLGF